MTVSFLGLPSYRINVNCGRYAGPVSDCLRVWSVRGAASARFSDDSKVTVTGQLQDASRQDRGLSVIGVGEKLSNDRSSGVCLSWNLMVRKAITGIIRAAIVQHKAVMASLESLMVIG
jgi:hypothetical protein